MSNSSVCTNIIFAACIICLFVLVICCVAGFLKWQDRTCITMCPVTGEGFTVQNNKDEPEWVRLEVARRIGNAARNIDKLVIHMYEKGIPDQNVAKRLAGRWKRIRSNSNGLRETGSGESSAAYTVNKGDQMRICVRDEKSDNLFENENDMMFVLIHELAHLMSKSYGHNLEFKKNFSIITRIAVELGIYDYIDYQKNPTNFCGTDITFPSY